MTDFEAPHLQFPSEVRFRVEDADVPALLAHLGELSLGYPINPEVTKLYEAATVAAVVEHQLQYNEAMTTTIRDQLTGELVAAVTREDFKAFAAARDMSPKAASATFTKLYTSLPSRYISMGVVDPTYSVIGWVWDEVAGVQNPDEKTAGFRVADIPKLKRYVAEYGDTLRGFGPTMRSVFDSFVSELLAPSDH